MPGYALVLRLKQDTASVSVDVTHLYARLMSDCPRLCRFAHQLAGGFLVHRDSHGSDHVHRTQRHAAQCRRSRRGIADAGGAEQHDPGHRCRLWRRVCVCDMRSEEHTSELQSLMRITYAVFSLKKKN